MVNSPYLVYGTVLDSNSSAVVSTNVIAHNTTTGERTLIVVTNSSGQYVLDLANLISGYTIGDSVTVYLRHNGYRGEATFTISGDFKLQDITTSNQVTFATLRNTLWKAVRDTLYSGTFAVSESSIFSAMNDQLISSEGYPIIILHRPEITRDGYTLPNTSISCDVSFLVEVFHTSDENCKILADEVENKFWKAQEVWDGLNLRGLNTDTIDNDWYTTGEKKIHIVRFKVEFVYEGQVTID